MSEMEKKDEQIELLKSLLEEQKKTQKIQKIILIVMCVAAGLVVIGGVILAPKVYAVFSEGYNTLQHINTLMDELQPTLDGLNNFDYESLNQTLQELKDAIGSLNNVLSFFG